MIIDVYLQQCPNDSLVNKYAMSGHGKTASSVPEGEEVARHVKPKAFCQGSSPGSGSSQKPKYVFMVHLLKHNFSI